jgi:hypothetical protein
MKWVSVFVLIMSLGFSTTSLAAELISGHYSTIDEGTYYDAIIRVERDLNGDVIGLTERFLVEGIPTKPFSFTCTQNLCVNREKSYWTITIFSNQEYEDRYNDMQFRYGLVTAIRRRPH